MKTNYNDSPIEILGLDEEIVKKLKRIFVYTVGQLQTKTESALKDCLIFQENTMEINIISNALVQKTGRGFEPQIDVQDSIENLKLERRIYRLLKRVGITRVSELMRICRLELKTIIGIDDKSCEKIEEKLKEYYSEKFEEEKNEKTPRNSDAMSLGYLDILDNLYLKLRNGEIHTVGDYQRKVDFELLSIEGIDEWDIEKINGQLSACDIKRYKDGEEGIETLDLAGGICHVHEENGILRVKELLEMTFEEVMKMHQCNGESIIEILKSILLKGRKVNFTEEVGTYKILRAQMHSIIGDQELQKKALRDIVENLRDISR